MFERFNNPQELFNWKLGSALTMERDIVEMLDSLIEEARQDGLKQVLRTHQSETRGHVSNIEEAFNALGWEVDDSPCPVISAIDKEGKANIKKSEEPVVDQVILGGAMETEHHEIAVYENLIINAGALGSEEVVQLLTRNLQEEQQALQKVRTLAEQAAAAGARQPV
ncbi:MAG TPA: ferritin-like domain-containing protein [Solirubrobacteraceae bacterium]|jgi:ferritin-like metal-binding protein YciE